MSALAHQYYADRTFLALAIWREARGEPLKARAAVGYAVLNRVARPGWWGHTVSEVLFKKWQFSSLTDPHDRQLTTWPAATDHSWSECLAVAWDTMAGAIANPTPGADSYHDTSIPPPPWTKTARLAGQVGRLKFYDVDHDYEAG